VLLHAPRRDPGGAPLPRAERLGVIQALADDAMRRVGDIIPVTPVPLACASIQTFDAHFVSRAQLLE
jgi:hypothetical protein